MVILSLVTKLIHNFSLTCLANVLLSFCFTLPPLTFLLPYMVLLCIALPYLTVYLNINLNLIRNLNINLMFGLLFFILSYVSFTFSFII